LLDENGDIILTPVKSRPVKKALAVTCDEINTPEEADALKSTKLYVYRSSLPETDEDDFYHSDLIGLEVKTTDGKRMGKVTAVHDFGAGDMLEIKPKDAASFFHPFTKAGVPKVDIQAGRIVIEVVEADNEEPLSSKGIVE
jgi:16S rRNA processing protein RimM